MGPDRSQARPGFEPPGAAVGDQGHSRASGYRADQAVAAFVYAGHAPSLQDTGEARRFVGAHEGGPGAQEGSPMIPDWNPFDIAPPGSPQQAPRSINNLDGVGDRLRAAAFAEIQAREAFYWAA